jgi:hypothetical protein
LSGRGGGPFESSSRQTHEEAVSAFRRCSDVECRFLAACPAPFVISEFLAANSGNQTNSIRDDDGDSSDWIEIQNLSATTEDISGFFLTDSATHLTKWRVPDGVVVPARGYLILFASGKNRTNAAIRLHTNFQLDRDGEYLALVDPGTNILSEFAPQFPPQNIDISYGRDPADPSVVGFYLTPTPGANNAIAGPGFGAVVQFSRIGGTFAGSFQLTLSAADSNSTIRYTLVSTAGDFLTATNIPTATSLLYTGAVTITNTVQVRARVFSANTNYFPGPPQTESYIAMSGSVTNFSSSLPIVIIHTLGAAPISTGLPVQDNSVIIACFDNDNDTHRSSLTKKPQLVKRAGINVRESIGSPFAKLSYAVELWDEFNADGAASMLGLPEESDWVLSAPNDWNTLGLYNPLFHQFVSELGHYAPRWRFVEVFFHNGSGALSADLTATNAAMGDYAGLCVLEEKVKRDKNRVNIDKLELEDTNAPAITGGYLVKGFDFPDVNERSFFAGGNYIYVDPDGLEMVTPARAAQS